MKFRVSINRKPGLSDPEGVATLRALNDMGYTEVDDVHFGRIITVEVGGETDQAMAQLTEMCERLLANPVIEDYIIEPVG